MKSLEKKEFKTKWFTEISEKGKLHLNLRVMTSLALNREHLA